MRGKKTNRLSRAKSKPIKKLDFVNPDDAVLNLLKRSKADLKKVRLVNFYLYFPTKDKADEAAAELIDLDFVIECVDESTDGKNWLCLATKNIIPKIQNLEAIRNTLENIAYKYEGVYDGWETGLDADEAEDLPNLE